MTALYSLEHSIREKTEAISEIHYPIKIAELSGKGNLILASWVLKGSPRDYGYQGSVTP